MSKWSNVPISGAHDWDGDLRKLLDADTAASAPLEVDWTDPDAIAANREMVADVMLPALADALHGIADRFADVPPVGRLAIIGGIADAVEAALRLPVVQEPSLADIFEADRLARIHTRERFLK